MISNMTAVLFEYGMGGWEKKKNEEGASLSEETVLNQKRKIRDIKSIKCESESDHDFRIYEPMNFFQNGSLIFKIKYLLNYSC